MHGNIQGINNFFTSMQTGGPRGEEGRCVSRGISRNREQVHGRPDAIGITASSDGRHGTGRGIGTLIFGAKEKADTTSIAVRAPCCA